MLEAAVPSPNTLPPEEPMLLLKEAFEPKDAPVPNAGALPKEGGLPNTGALPKPPVEGKIELKQGSVTESSRTCTGSNSTASTKGNKG